MLQLNCEQNSTYFHFIYAFLIKYDSAIVLIIQGEYNNGKITR